MSLIKNGFQASSLKFQVLSFKFLLTTMLQIMTS